MVASEQEKGKGGSKNVTEKRVNRKGIPSRGDITNKDMDI